MSYGETVLLMAAGFWGIFLLNGITNRLAVLIDRRFFREAYNAEQILSELAERVRTIVETEPLLATVTQRISEALHVSRMAVLLMMANLEASLRGQVSVLRNTPELMQRINKMVYAASSSNRYATFFYAEYDPETRRATYVNAGHNPPVILRTSAATPEVFRWEVGGTVIGLLPNAEYREGSFELQRGDMVVLFTDGIPNPWTVAMKNGVKSG